MDILDRLAQETLVRIEEGYYANVAPVAVERRSFAEAIRRAPLDGENPVIAEIKPVSPSSGWLLDDPERDVPRIVELYRRSGVVGISVLTDPTHFGGSLAYLERASQTGLPTLMKDFLLSEAQLDAAVAYGASAVLFILTLFRRDYPERTLEGMVAAAHERGLEVLLEVNSPEEYDRALETEADMIGINHRNLATLELDLSLTERVLARGRKDRPVWALSGIEAPCDVERLRRAGADAFLVGTSLMRSRERGALLQGLIYGKR